MNDELTETARAIQEVAKTTKAGIEATEKLGGFVSRITNEPLETIIGIFNDRLQFMRWERRLRLYNREQEILQERGVGNHIRTVPPKLALPIVENASLEENDELQDLWANLLASALDPDFKGAVRSAFIDIIKQLEVIDVHILDAMYDEMLKGNDKNIDALANYLSRYLFSPNKIVDRLGIELDAYESSIDNLLRLRLVSSNTAYRRYSASDSYAGDRGDLLNHADYDLVCLTPLGLSFIETCIGQRRK